MRIFIFLLTFWASAAMAQTYPIYLNTTVNDNADLLSVADEAELSAQLDKLREDTGVEMTVLTLPSQAGFAPDQTLEQFATGLFNHWGIGDAEANNGVLVLILKDDRAMRIELGAAYGRDWDTTATRIVDNVFLPAFKETDYPNGIMDGSTAIIDRIVSPFVAGDDAPSVSGGKSGLWFFGAIFAAFAALASRQRIGDGMARFRSCPSCGRRGMRQNREVVTAATTSSSGMGRKRVRCTHCAYVNDADYVISQRSKRSSSSGGFGGGRSGGGGASGRW